MSKHLLAILCWVYFGGLWNINGVYAMLISIPRCALRPPLSDGLRSMHRSALFAKKRLISDDPFASFDEPADPSTIRQQTTTVSSAVKAKKPASKQKLISDALLASLIEEDAQDPVEHIGKGNHSKVGNEKVTAITDTPPANSHCGQKQQKQKGTAAVDDTHLNHVSTDSSVPVAAHKGNKPEKDRTRKDKPSSRVRFTASAQPNFVSIGLDKVSLLFGNEVVLKDATFSVNTGERVGLVGPNGGGKVSGS